MYTVIYTGRLESDLSPRLRHKIYRGADEAIAAMAAVEAQQRENAACSPFRRFSGSPAPTSPVEEDSASD